MTRRNWVKLSLATILLGLSALPARASTIPVTEFDGVNLTYTATVTLITPTLAELQISYTAGFNFVSKINGQVVLPPPGFSSTFTGTPMSVDPTTYTTFYDPTVGGPNVTAIGGGAYSIGLSDVTNNLTNPGTQGGDIGINDNVSPSSVVLNYLNNNATTTGPQALEGLTLNGQIFVDTVNYGNTIYSPDGGITNYDFSAFLPGNPSYMTSWIMTLNSSDDLIDALISGTPGTFSGSASFTALATAVPEPASAVLFCMGGILAGVASRRRGRKA